MTLYTQAARYSYNTVYCYFFFLLTMIMTHLFREGVTALGCLL